MELKGEGFTLREWRADDVIPLQKLADNAKISDYLLDRFPYPYTMDDAVQWVGLMQNQQVMLNFVIEVDGGFAGGIGLDLKEDVYRITAQMGYWLGEPFWGRGIMPKAAKLVAAYAFERFGVMRIQAGAFGNNPKSMRVLEKAGFVKEAILKNKIIKKGVVLDEHLYALLKIGDVRYEY